MSLDSSYTSPTNQTVLNTIDSASKTVSQYSSITNVSGAGVAGAMESSFIQSGISAITSLLSVASSLDRLISGATADFGPDSPIRSTTNSLLQRNKASENNENPNTKIDTNKKLTGGGEDISFPPTVAQNHIEFEFLKYYRPTPFGNTNTNPIGRVILPLPDALQDSTSANWQDSGLGVAGLAMNNIQNFDSLTENLGTGTTEAVVYTALKSAEALGVSESLLNTARAEFGVVENPALAQLFQGIGFRNHEFSWTFAPKNPTESAIIKNIIRAFKRHSLPTYTSSISAFFNYPDIVQPKFSEACENYLYVFKKCVIKNVSANYNVAGTPSFFKGTNAPTFIQMSISLAEMEYVMSEDYGGERNGESFKDKLGDKAAGVGNFIKKLGSKP